MNTQVATLLRAIEIAGGLAALSGRLGVPQRQILGWIAGELEPPPAYFLKAADIVMAADAAFVPPSTGANVGDFPTGNLPEV